MNRKSRTLLPIVLGIVIGFLVLLCVICAMILGRLYLPSLWPKQVAPDLMPADTVFFASVNPDVQGLAGFKHLADVYGGIPEVKDALDELSEEMEDELNISFEDDVMSWLGPEVAVAVTNIDALIEGDEPMVTIAAATRNIKASDAFLEKLREHLEDQDYDVEKETYNDVAYYVQEVEYDWETPMIFGTVEKLVILTTDEEAMQDVIDVAQGKADALAQNERYTELVNTLPDDAVAYTFFDMENVAEAILENLEYEGIYLPRETSDQLEALQTVGLALSLDEEGIQFDVAVALDPDALSTEMLENLEARASAHRILKRIPDDALGFSSGQNLAAGWRTFLTNMQQNPDFKYQVEDLGRELGLRIDEELLDWLTGEFAIAVVRGGIEDVPVGGFAVFEIDSQEEAQDVLEDLADVMEELAFLEFEKMDINDVEMQVLMDPFTEEIVLGYGFTDRHLVIGFMEDGLEAAVDDDTRPIADDINFKKVQKHLPDKTSGYFYVNVEAAWRLTYESMGAWERQDFDETVRPFLEPIKAIGVAASPTDTEKGIGQSSLFIYIPGE